jgi:RimJ/RimL family protein N-acetyltransferase
MTERELLRMHIEAVWGIGIPPLDGQEIELAAGVSLPPWPLYLATLVAGQVMIWRPGVTPDERTDVLRRADAAGAAYDPDLGMRREIVLWQTTPRPTPVLPPSAVVRRLAPDDAPLLEAFEADSADYFLAPEHAPCTGVVVDGQLASVAHSSRRTADACELGINTALGARRHGYATAATLAWTAAIAREGLCPIYSAFAYNTASLRLAAAAGYARVCESVYGPVEMAAGQEGSGVA